MSELQADSLEVQRKFAWGFADMLWIQSLADFPESHHRSQGKSTYLSHSHCSLLSHTVPDVPVLQREHRLGFFPGSSVPWEYEQSPVPLLDLLFAQHVRMEPIAVMHTFHYPTLQSSSASCNQALGTLKSGILSWKPLTRRSLLNWLHTSDKSALFNNHVPEWDPGVYFAGKCIFSSHWKVCERQFKW